MKEARSQFTVKPMFKLEVIGTMSCTYVKTRHVRLYHYCELCSMITHCNNLSLSTWRSS